MFNPQSLYLILATACITNSFLIYALLNLSQNCYEEEDEKSSVPSKESIQSSEAEIVSPTRKSTKHQKEFFFHEACPCKRLRKKLPRLAVKHDILGISHAENPPIIGSYVGPSKCNIYTTSLGYGQKVVSYSFYEPFHNKNK